MSVTDEGATPQFLFDALNTEFGFTLDPCANPDNAKCKRFYTKSEDGLKQDWANEIVFMNPQYGCALNNWMRKAFESSFNGAIVICLVTARTDTHWWHNYAMRAEVRFLRKRLKFGTAQITAPFPSVIVIFRPPASLLATSEFSTSGRMSVASSNFALERS